MKIKLSDQSITFKITEDEMNRLLSDFPLETAIAAGPNKIRVSLEPDAPEGSAPALDIVPDPSGAKLVLHLHRSDILKLSVMGKDKNGLSIKTGGLDISVQVDVRADSRRKNAPLKQTGNS